MMAMLEATHGNQMLMITVVALGGTSSGTISTGEANPFGSPANCDVSEPTASQPETTSADSPAACSVSTTSSAKISHSLYRADR